MTAGWATTPQQRAHHVANWLDVEPQQLRLLADAQRVAAGGKKGVVLGCVADLIKYVTTYGSMQPLWGRIVSTWQQVRQLVVLGLPLNSTGSLSQGDIVLPSDS